MEKRSWKRFSAAATKLRPCSALPRKKGSRPDALRAAAQEKGLTVHQFKSLRDTEAARAMQEAGADIGIMAFVLQFAPHEFVTIPKHGTIQYHPSLPAEISRSEKLD